MRNLKIPHMLTSCTAIAMLAACSPSSKSDEQSAVAHDAAEAPPAAMEVAADSGLPDIGRAAPGVAFAYTYAFTMPATAIAQAQQQHAAACGKLGLDRCRITGMRFDQSGETEARGQLDLLIAPELAHDFGREATALVEKAEGKLDSAAVNGTDAGGAIDLSHRRSADLRNEIARIEARLKVAGLAKETRVELERRLEGLNAELRNQTAGRADAERSLATTPMQFAYSDQGLIADGSGFSGAAAASWSSASTALSLVLIVAGFALPWVALIGLLWLAVIGARRLRGASKPSPETAAT